MALPKKKKCVLNNINANAKQKYHYGKFDRQSYILFVRYFFHPITQVNNVFAVPTELNFIICSNKIIIKN